MMKFVVNQLPFSIAADQEVFEELNERYKIMIS